MTHSTHPLTLHSLFQPTDKYPRKFSLTSTDTQKDDQLDMPPCATCEERLDGPLMRLMNALLDVLIDVSFVVSVNILVDVAIHALLDLPLNALVDAPADVNTNAPAGVPTVPTVRQSIPRASLPAALSTKCAIQYRGYIETRNFQRRYSNWLILKFKRKPCLQRKMHQPAWHRNHLNDRPPNLHHTQNQTLCRYKYRRKVPNT